MLSCLGDHLERKFEEVPHNAASSEFLQLLIEVAQNPSLMVSIPILVTWTRILSHRTLGPSDLVSSTIAPLLEVCSSRLVRYENLPDDSNDATYLFLMEDTDTVPERHAFLGNYRRYSSQIIEQIVQLKLVDAISYILGRTEYILQNLYEGQPAFDSRSARSPTFLAPAFSANTQITEQTYKKHSMPALRVDSHFTVIEATLKGYVKWRLYHVRDHVRSLGVSVGTRRLTI